MRRLLTVFFRLLYYELAWTYDLVSWTVSIGQWRAWQRTALPYLRGERVLEVGHGPGHMLLALAREGRQPVGLDLSPYMSRQARRRLQRALGPEAVRLLRSRVEALPFAAGSFDSVLATFPTEYIGYPATIAELNRVLRPGGVVVAVPAAQITGPLPPDRFADWLFRVTGQSATNWFTPLLDRYRATGFDARLEHVRLPRSVVTLIVAEKGGSG